MESLPDITKTPEKGSTKPISPEQSEGRLKDAMLLFEQGNSDAAIYMLQQLAKDDPTNHKVLFKLGEMAIAAKNWAYAIQVLRKASFLRSEDIELRLILMDIYKAYQMPVQEIIVAKEILGLDPHHVMAIHRLANLYRGQAMQLDEIRIRLKLKKLAPNHYQNLKRLAMIFYKSGHLWESAKVYEQIRKYHPENFKDLRHLAAIYDKLGEAFREADVLDHIAKKGGGGSWMQSRAETMLRKQNRVFDPLVGGLTFKTESEPTMKVDTYASQLGYTRIRIRSSVDVGIAANYTRWTHRGIDLLDGDMVIDNTSILFNVTKHWVDKFTALDAAVGFSHDEVSGRLFGRSGDISIEDFPFLEDPSFNSYGGTIPIAKVQLTSKPWLFTNFSVSYEHNVMADLDARLSLFTYDQITAIASYQANDKTELQARIDNLFISDGNYRIHGLLSGYYTLWASTAKYDYRGRRNTFLRFLPDYFVRLGYEFEYFKDKQRARDEKYQTFINSEYRHKGVILGQAELYSFASAKQILALARLSYGGGTTLDSQKSMSLRIFLYDPNFENEIGISYLYEDELSGNTTAANRRIAGQSKSHQISLNFKWRF